MKGLTGALRHLAEGVAALMMAAIFVLFVVQIAVRYVVGQPWFADAVGIDAANFGWTLEAIMVLWLWIIFWCCAFVVRERDHVSFDVLYLWARPGPRRVMALMGAVCVMAALWLSIEPTWGKMRILRIKSSATLPVKMLPLYSIYFLFLAAVGARYGWRAWQALRGTLPEGDHAIAADVKAGERGE